MDIDLENLTAELDERLAADDAALAVRYPGERAARQPVHTVYVPADRYTAGLCPDWGDRALHALDSHEDLFAELVGDDGIVERVRGKLRAEPVEDLRIDFEDGYGPHPDDAEDADVRAAADALARDQREGAAPPFHGIRIKSFEAPTRARGVRTLGLFLGTLAGEGGQPGVITLPKVTSVAQVEAMVYACEHVEAKLGLARLGFEIQVETPQSILGPDGTALVARMIHAVGGRCTALHYGTYDYSAFCGIAAEYQSMAHPAADHAKLVMQAAAAGTGVRLSDGSTNVLPVGDQVREGWELHLDLVRRSLERGYYQGWDLHPAQLPTRYAATFAFYRRGLEPAAARLRAYTGGGDSAILDEPATARALADFLLRSLHCGAADDDEIQGLTGLDREGITGLARPGR
ncbi:MAG: aldolase [Streptosporangiales bacterium]|nr:aldolase [Streptosporangiales bacterium]